MDSISEEQFSDWARRMQASDEYALKELFDATFEPYVRYAWRFTNKKSSAMDIVQESFIKLWEIRSKLDPSQSLKTYIYTMIKHKSLNHLRDSDQYALPIDEIQLTDDSFSSSESSGDIKLIKPLKKWINALPDRQQEAFKLSRYEGLIHDEIAEIMEISPRTVNNHIVSALKNLRDHYHTYKDANRTTL